MRTVILNGGAQGVTVGMAMNHQVELSIRLVDGGVYRDVALTPEQARVVARALVAEAKRIEAAMDEMKRERRSNRRKSRREMPMCCRYHGTGGLLSCSCGGDRGDRRAD